MIVSTKLRFRPEIDGVILIDCWDYTNWTGPGKQLKIPVIDNFYINLSNQIKNFKNVFRIIDATTQLNTNKFSERLNQELKSVAPMTFIDDCDKFINFCENNPGIKNWLVAGQSWGLCVHDNNMGLRAFQPLINSHQLNFYATEFSFLKESGYRVEHKDFLMDNLEWEYLNYFGYRLF